MLVAGTILLSVAPVFVILYLTLNYWISGKKNICIVVLGDVGRSPRMQYHALSFVKTGFNADIVGYGGSELQEDLKNKDNVSVHYLTEPPDILKYLPRLVVYFLKVIWQAVSLGLCLLLIPKCGFILLQNPPCIPTLAVCWMVCWLRGSRLVIDWHNYGYSILALALGQNHLLVRFAKWYEKLFGRLSSDNICVTNAMKEDLKNNWGIRASVMYDRPPAMFKETDIQNRHRLFTKLAEEYPVFKGSQPDPTKTKTAFTEEKQSGDIIYVENRPALLVSSTSWTEDEDFGVLLQALTEYETSQKSGKSQLPDIVCVITGKGPQKEYYREKISSLDWKHVRFCLPWLSPEDYPVLLDAKCLFSHDPAHLSIWIQAKAIHRGPHPLGLLEIDGLPVPLGKAYYRLNDDLFTGSSDLGVCLHKSSSGLDLPMKVVDMFGCGLPVCAIHFHCLNELVKHEVNGLVFHDSKELAQQIQDLFQGFPSHQEKLGKFRENLSSFQGQRWQQCWERDVLPLFIDNGKEKKDS